MIPSSAFLSVPPPPASSISNPPLSSNHSCSNPKPPRKTDDRLINHAISASPSSSLSTPQDEYPSNSQSPLPVLLSAHVKVRDTSRLIQVYKLQALQDSSRRLGLLQAVQVLQIPAFPTSPTSHGVSIQQSRALLTTTRGVEILHCGQHEKAHVPDRAGCPSALKLRRRGSTRRVLCATSRAALLPSMPVHIPHSDPIFVSCTSSSVVVDCINVQ
ncbi:hypothetical protein B0H13DRAFT_2006985 [Mycena leptocephala]|nr:hypothetical protein B0H13DRAFT_2006985 [Mycena leptocephala]